MDISLKLCGIEDLDTLRELSIRTYYETFAALNTPENMQEYLLRQILVEEAHAEDEMTPERVRELEVQIVLTRTFCESLRGARFFHPDLDLEILKREAVRRIVDNTLSAMARVRGLTIPELLQRKSAELRRSLQTRN